MQKTMDESFERLNASAEAKNAWNEENFWDRQPVDHMHGAKIDRIGRRKTTFEKVYQKVFSHHTLNYFVDRKDTPSDYEQIFEQEAITRLFLSTVYEYPRLYEGLYEDESVAVNFESFLDQILPNPSELRPRASCLVGRIGVGKSTFLSALLVKNHEIFKAQNVIALRYELKSSSYVAGWAPLFFKNLFAWLCMTIPEFLDDEAQEESFRSFSYPIRRNLIDQEDLSENRPNENIAFQIPSIKLIGDDISRLIKWVRNYANKRLLLIIDGLDEYFHAQERFSFFPGDNPHLKDLDVLRRIVLELCDPEGIFRDTGISVIFALRFHVRESLDHHHLLDTYVPLEISTFRLKGPEPRVLIAGRMELFRRLMKRRGTEEDRKILPSIKDLEDVLLRGVSDKPGFVLENLMTIGHHEYRAHVDHLRKLDWGATHGLLLNRLFKESAPLLLTYMLKRRRLYTQNDKYFPNMFLVRGNLGNYEPSNSVYPPEAKLAHRQTYWLKYLIAIVVDRLTDGGSRSNHTKSLHDRLVSIFSDGNESDDTYEDYIVRLAYGSLRDQNAFDVIEPDVLPAGGPTMQFGYKQYKLTRRGEWLVRPDRGFDPEKGKHRYKVPGALSFEYLQLVVDDYLLQIPELGGITKPFEFLKEAQPSYQYLTYLAPGGRESESGYSQRVDQMTKWKGKLAFLFLEILDSALEAERRRYPKVFAKLDELKVELPKLDMAKDSLAEFLKILMTRPSASEFDISYIAGSRENAKKARPRIDAFFKRVHGLT